MVTGDLKCAGTTAGIVGETLGRERDLGESRVGGLRGELVSRTMRPA